MLAPEHWPQIPDEWQEINAQLDARLKVLPALDADFFTNRQQECIAHASEDKTPSASGRSLIISKYTVKTHLRDAADRFREIQAELNGTPLDERARRIYTHGLVYVSLDNKIISVEGEVGPAELAPHEALILKGLALGETVNVAARRVKIWRSLLTQTVLPKLEEKMGASNPGGMMGNGYRMRLFVPRTVIQAPGEPEAANS